MEWVKWLRVDLGDSIGMLTAWVAHTNEILNHNWTLAESFSTIGIK
jgi:hypothetical protein